MDEVVFRTSQKVDTLQYQLKLAANEGKHAIFHFSEKAKGTVLQILENPKCGRIVEALKAFIACFFEFHRECKEYVVTHYHPKVLLRKVLFLGKNFSKRDILIGSAGLIIGAIIGFCVSYTIPINQKVLRCMQAIQCLKYSGIEAVMLVEDAFGPRECGKNEVLINVKAASINLIDIEICKGYGSLIRNVVKRFFKNCDALPVTLGRDCTGIVVDIGNNVNRLEIGDEVWLTSAFWASGTMAEYVVIPENKVSHKPKMLSFEGATSLPYSGTLALSVLKRINVTSQNANTKRIFVHGGCSAVGCVLVQILVAWGANITITCYKRSVPVAKALGVKDIIGMLSRDNLCQEENISLLKQELYCREKFDAIITTTVCELNNAELAKFCKSNGKMVSTLPHPLKSDSSKLLMKSIYSIHYYLYGYIQKIFTGTVNSFGEDNICYHMLDELKELVENGKIQTVVDRVFQPHDAEHALNHFQSMDSIGSTVITFR